MFDNLPKEIFYYSLIPVAILGIIVFILFMVGKKKYDNYYKYNYFIKILSLIIVGLVLPVIIGYTIYTVQRLIIKGTLFANIFYVIILCVLDISFIIMFIIICRRLIKNIKDDDKEDKENKKSF